MRLANLRLHRPTLLAVREMLQQDFDGAEHAARERSSLPADMRAVEAQRTRVYKGLLTEIDAAIAKAEDF